MSQIRSYGSWPSPITAADVAAAGRRFADLCVDAFAAGGARLYWLESRPDEAGRNTVMRTTGGGAESLLEPPTSARSAVHEYGGGAFTVHADTLWFVDSADQALWQRSANGNLTQLTAPDESARFADLQFEAHHRRLWVVVETPQADDEPIASVEIVDLDGCRQRVASGHDFYASPRVAPAGDRAVWLAWNHPHMPWDQTSLWQAAIAEDGSIGDPQCLWAPADTSLFGPLFDPTGRLYVVADGDNWWNIHRESARGDGFEQLTGESAEFGLPQWVFRQSTCAFTDDGRLFALCTRDGLWQLGEVDLDSGEFSPMNLGHDFFELLQPLGNGLVVVAADAAMSKTILSVAADGATRTLRASPGLGDVRLSRPESVSWPTGDGGQAHGLFYPPTSAAYVGPVDERPPVLLKCHGGPTGATSTALDTRIQYWTSRGYAVLDVNYRGSTGYGRAYRQQLTGAWGVADVEDCVAGARYLAAAGRIDADRVLISGSSAGGYTVLCVLTFTDVAAAGTSYYGIGDLQRLLASTHKFESRYLDRLIGDDLAVFAARSPLMHAEQLACPVLFLQGAQDKVVPPDQARAMADALKQRGVPVAHIEFAEERHGFRDAANIVTAIESERSFYTRVLAITGVEDLRPLAIENFAG